MKFALFTASPTPAKCGQRPQKSPVHQLALAHGLDVRTPITFKDETARADFAALKADVAVVAAYGPLLPQAVLQALSWMLKYPCVPLPLAGAAPIHRAIAVRQETGICIMQMEPTLIQVLLSCAKPCLLGPPIPRANCMINWPTRAVAIQQALDCLQ